MKRTWWKEAVVYQVYPRSFMDSNGDGIGDLKGIISKLDYLKDLGISVIWLSPVYKSPNDDNGYDISDYYDVMTEFGTMSDLNELITEMHLRGLKLVMDLVINHTSDEHPWFIESRSSKNNPKRDYYIWRPRKDGKEPNNWSSVFTPSAWEYDETTGEYFLHLFSKRQPDLNWNNEEVKAEIFKMINWWLDKGIDGFRMDVINLICKDGGFQDSLKSETGYVFADEMYVNLPGVHTILREMNEKILSHYDIMTVGETIIVTPEIASLYVDEKRNELNMVFHFELMELDKNPSGEYIVMPLKLTDIKSIITKWQLGLNGRGWNSLYLNNHDQPRMVSRFGNDKAYRVESSKMLATLLHTLQGTPYIYQGEEIGMTNMAFQSIEEYRDIFAHSMYRQAISKGTSPEKALQYLNAQSRDHARTPMQWNAAKNAGFSSGEPWIQVNPNFIDINVEKDIQNAHSVLNYYKKLIKLRKNYPVIVYGDYEPLFESDEQIFSYLRTFEGNRLLVILNFSGKDSGFKLPETIHYNSCSLLISNYPQSSGGGIENINMLPYEARVFLLE